LPGNFVLGLGLAVAAYTLVGLGVGAAGTSLLVLVAGQVDDRRRAAAATIMWVLMVAGFAITATAVGHFLDPFSPRRLLFVTAAAAGAAFLVAALAVFGVERPSRPAHPANAGVASAMGRAAAGRAPAGQSFQAALRQVWAEPQARGFTLFVFVSMLAYSAQELILEPFAGLVFGYTLGESSKLSGLQHGAVFLGMVTVGLAGSVTVRGARRFGSLRAWTIGGCLASALALLAMAGADVAGPAWPLRTCVAALGFSNGVFAVAAIGSMMELSGAGGAGRAGVRMGLWGAAQAVAFALGGLFGTSIVDSVRFLSGAPTLAFGIVFSAEAALFLLAAGFAAQVDSPNKRGSTADSTAVTI
jgi:BCD family chlorophyll transporter-like MFS transporter